MISYQFVIRKSTYNVAWQRQTKKENVWREKIPNKWRERFVRTEYEKGREKVNAYLLPDKKEKCAFDFQLSSCFVLLEKLFPIAE